MMAKYISGILKHNVHECDDGSEALDVLRNENIDLVISDIKMPGISGVELLQEIKKYPNMQNVEVILFTGFAEVDTAVQALRLGAFDYLNKPLNLNKLAEIIEKVKNLIDDRNAAKNSAIDISDEASEMSFTSNTIGDAKKQKTRNEASFRSEHSVNRFLENGAFFNLPSGERVGVFSNRMKEVVNTALIFHDDRSIPVLIEGESGTGKELIAKIVHFGYNDKNVSPLISINCSAISPSLFESELFGYEGHTFTGAKESGMKGKLELANGGTIFLDEIGDMPLEMQPKLLRVLQDKQLYKIGANKPINLDIRIIAATNRNLEEMVNEGRFRSDLYHRLKIGWINLPSLRQQKNSISSIAQMFLIESSEKRNKQFKYISKDAVKILENNSWNGNIRELKNIIERIVLLYDEIELRPEHLNITNTGVKNEAIGNKMTLMPGNFKLPEINFNLREIELEIVQLAMHKFNNNKSKTAQYLGLTLSALRSRLNNIKD